MTTRRRRFMCVFRSITASVPALEGAAIVIWTTTPWTMPGNRAVAYGAAIDYVVIEVTGAAENSMAKVGEKLLVAQALLDALNAAAGSCH